MRALSFAVLLRTALALVLLAAGLAVLAGFDRMGHRMQVAGAAGWVRYPAGLWQVLAAVLLMTPLRIAYGAALGAAAGIAAVAVHATALGWDSAPPAIAVATLCTLIAWRRREQFRT